MFHKSKMREMTYGIIGLGKFGEALALALAEGGADLIVVDQDEEKVREMREYTENAYVVQNLEKKTLQEVGLQNCDIAIVCIGEHLDTSILTTLNLVSMGIPKVIAKANGLEHGEILTKLGAEVVFPEKDTALRLATRLETSKVLDIIQLSEKINISKLNIPEFMVGRMVVEADLRSRFGLNIIAIENQSSVIEHIRPEYKFRSEDILYLSGAKEGFEQLIHWIETR